MGLISTGLEMIGVYLFIQLHKQVQVLVKRVEDLEARR